MEWNAQEYHETCGKVTERGAELVNELRKMQCKRVLDLGCGTGVLTNDIAAFVEETVGIDSSPAMIEKAKATYPEIGFYVMDACSLPWNDCFDAVFSNSVFHFIKAQDALLRRVHRSLKMDGALLCEFGAAGNVAGLLDAVEAACEKHGRHFSLRFYYPTLDEYHGLLMKHGFSVGSIDAYGLDTSLRGGEAGLRNWISQIFQVEMEWFDPAEREEALSEIEAAVRPAQWDGACWHLPNRRIRVTAYKRL